ncbi:hypothetical protein F2Q69_00030462 [Brassica cretica]|uniref:Uncharacterized protein n=1 Tax=Brassica cretica TaxID=69181 RepID=A0A8S9RZH7_BRACR|nr:hypothetical protein F2Q69_00030462 [Brassica cretica]
MATNKSSSFFHLFAPPLVPDYSRLKLCLLSANLCYQKQGQILLSFLRRQPERGIVYLLSSFPLIVFSPTATRKRLEVIELVGVLVVLNRIESLMLHGFLLAQAGKGSSRTAE